jgi:hypothetical protein
VGTNGQVVMKKKDIASSLVEEGLKEAAEEFFGRRVRLEEEVDLLRSLAADLKKMEQKVIHWRNLLYYLLLDGDREAIDRFFSAISVDLHEEEFEYNKDDVVLDNILVPFSFLKKNKYKKIVLDVYHNLSISIETYYNGEFYTDKFHPGKKILSVHYNQLEKITDDLNREIEKNNLYSKTSDILQFAKKMDVDAENKERIIDTGVHYTLDEEMKLDTVDFRGFGLAQFTLLPQGKEVKEKVFSFLGVLYTENKHRIHELLTRIEEAEQARIKAEKGKKPIGRVE